MLKRLFKPRPTQLAAEALYAVMVAQARQPRLYTDLGAPDTAEGRFEIYSLHTYLILERLKGQGAPAADLAQVFFDTFLSGLDNGLRELGVGDLSVGKRMRKLGEAFYSRVHSWEKALAALPDRTELEAMLARTVYANGDASPAPKLAEYVLAQREALAAQDLERLMGGRLDWASL